MAVSSEGCDTDGLGAIAGERQASIVDFVCEGSSDEDKLHSGRRRCGWWAHTPVQQSHSSISIFTHPIRHVDGCYPSPSASTTILWPKPLHSVWFIQRIQWWSMVNILQLYSNLALQTECFNFLDLVLSPILLYYLSLSALVLKYIHKHI